MKDEGKDVAMGVMIDGQGVGPCQPEKKGRYAERVAITGELYSALVAKRVDETRAE